MGMFDDLRCHYPLPREGANALAYQTKDTPAQWMDLYEIRAVELAEIDAVLEVARTIGPAAHLQALAARTAWLCVRRPPEILSMTTAQETPEGLRFRAAKRKAGEAERTALIAWSPELRATLDEAKAVKRRDVDITPLIFGNQKGQRYTQQRPALLSPVAIAKNGTRGGEGACQSGRSGLYITGSPASTTA